MRRLGFTLFTAYVWTAALSSCGGSESGNSTVPRGTVAGFESCGNASHGETESRVRYQAASVDAGSTCVSQTQTRTCNDGDWGQWPGTYTFETCIVDGFESCENTPHDDSESRIRYQAASVDAGSTCVPQTQKRTCNNGQWGDWSGTYTFETCIVADLEPCGNTPHDGSEDRIRYQAASVDAGSTCVPQTQKRTRNNGQWGDWSGTYTFETCIVDGFESCGDTPHDGSEDRIRYQAASVPAGSSCVSETQTRTCNDGDWSEGSGTFEYDSCSVDRTIAEAREQVCQDQVSLLDDEALRYGVCSVLGVIAQASFGLACGSVRDECLAEEWAFDLVTDGCEAPYSEWLACLEEGVAALAPIRDVTCLTQVGSLPPESPAPACGALAEKCPDLFPED